jgi:hypothetical protein
MFELLSDNTVEKLASKLNKNKIPFGFGGIASLGKGLITAERIIMEHYRLGSTRAILSRSFCNTQDVTDLDQIEKIFVNGVAEIRAYEKYCEESPHLWERNRREVADLISEISDKL